MNRVLVAGLVLWMAAVSGAPALAQTAPALLTPPQVRIHPVTGSGAATIRLQNGQATAIDVVLTGVPSEGLSNDARVTFARDDVTTPGELSLRLTIPPRAVERVAIAVANVRNAGDYAIDLYDGATKIGTVTVRRAVLGISVETPAEGQSVKLTRGTPTDRVLTNADPFQYVVKWDWFGDGQELCAGETEVPAHGTVLLRCNPSVARSFGALFRQPVVQSVLTLHADTRPPSGQPPLLKRQTIAATTASIAPALSQTLTYLVLVLVLIAGGVSSLLLNTALPNFLQKLSLKEQLLGLGVRIGNLSNNVESRIRVLIRLERSRLLGLLRSRWTLSPEFASVVSMCTNGIAQLRSRVDALQQLDLIVERLGNALHGDVPPTLVRQIEKLQRRANALLTKTEPTESDLRDALAAIAEASNLVDSLDEPGDEFGIKLVARVKAVRDVAKTMSALPTWAEITAAVKWPWVTVESVDAAATTVPAAQYAQLDGAVCRVEIMQHYAQLRFGRPNGAGSQSDAELSALTPEERDEKVRKQKQLVTHEAAMRACLGNPSHGALVSASRLLREIGEEVYSDDLKKALVEHPPGAGISVEPDIAYEFAPLTFCVEFYDQFLNDAAARHDWICEWDFGDTLSGRGSIVSHYFDLKDQRGETGDFTVTARVRDADGKLVMEGIRDGEGKPATADTQAIALSRKVTIRRSQQGKKFESRAWAEAAKLAAALLIAIFGLIAGAQEQLVKLDVVPGLVAVFLVGFGADTIKNLLTTKS